MLIPLRRLSVRILLGLRFPVLLAFGFSLDGRPLVQLPLPVPLVIETPVYDAWPCNLVFSSGTVPAAIFLRAVEAIGRSAFHGSSRLVADLPLGD
jgi:hypothetical protein